ncbi:MAG TPA: glutamate formimidoyltransferase [Bryobacteraceae bacterium]|nr:glutamate formimidoyltransferase [Bryobacteraceae bacterium]
MARRLVECVPNFSEGRDAARVEDIASAIASVPGVVILDREMDADHNRSVITFAGPPEAVLEAAFRGVERAVALIDLNRHEGVHPRIGAADVVPFVPVEGVTLEDCVRLAERLGEAVWQRLRVPVYFYEAAARRPERVNLENIRRGQFEGLREEIETNPDRAPDLGEPRLHPTAGATVIGARKFLIAYNINLGTADVEIAKKIARAIRFSSGGFRYVKAMGVPLASRNLAQVSMNLTDFEQTPIHRVFEAVRTEAARYGVNIVGSEIVGLIPRKAVEMAAEFYLRCENFSSGAVLENRLAGAMESAGLDEFLEALAAPSATPGGGSAAAAAGAMAAALGAMVAGLAKVSAEQYTQDRLFFSSAVRRDARAYEAVLAAYRKPKEERGPFVEEALRQAAAVPLEVAERAAALKRRLGELAQQAPPKFSSDIETARALASAAVTGAVANVRINLASIADETYRQAVEERLRALESD